jgi:hypothetical protein
MSVESVATPLPVVCDGDHGQLLSFAPCVNCVPSPAPSFAAGCPPTVSQSTFPPVSVHKLPSISNPATGEPGAGDAPVHGAAAAAAARGPLRPVVSSGDGDVPVRTADASPWPVVARSGRAGALEDRAGCAVDVPEVFGVRPGVADSDDLLGVGGDALELGERDAEVTVALTVNTVAHRLPVEQRSPGNAAAVRSAAPWRAFGSILTRKVTLACTPTLADAAEVGTTQSNVSARLFRERPLPASSAPELVTLA